MKRYIILLVLSLILSGITNVSGSNVDDGKKIFNEKCNGCHGKRSDVPPISKLSQISEQDIKQKVRNGVEGTLMRGFSTDELSDNDLNNIIAYLKTFSSSNVANNKSSTKKSPGFDTIFTISGILIIYIIKLKNK